MFRCFFFLSPLSLSPVLSWFLSPALPPSHPATCANQFHLPLFIFPSPNLFPPSLYHCRKKPIVFMCISISRISFRVYTLQFYLPFVFLLLVLKRKKVFLLLFEATHVTFPLLELICSANTFSYSPFLTPCSFFFLEPHLRQQPVISTAPPPHPPTSFFFLLLLLSLLRVKERVRDG